MTTPLDRGWSKVPPALVTVHNQAAQQGLRMTVTRSVTQLWRTLAPYNKPEAQRFIEHMVPLMSGAQTAMSGMTQVHLHQMVSAESGRPAPLTPLPGSAMTGAAVRDGVPPDEVYQRPFTTLWYRLGQGDEPARARAAGLHRAVTLALTDVQLAKIHTARAVLQAQPEVTAFRRVTRGDASCELCTTAMGPYPLEQLLPIHSLCRCDVAPVLGEYPSTPPAPPPTTEIGPVLNP